MPAAERARGRRRPGGASLRQSPVEFIGLVPAARRARLGGGSAGQASVELIGVLPLIAVIALAALTIMASHVADEQAGEAAEAAALALLQGGLEPKQAAEQALSTAARRRATITVSGRRVHVRVRARVALPIPGLADRLAGEARADAGP